ncbi:MAG: RNA polymerase II transcription factor B subunit 4 [Bogoriella megaspora]|nr:MAG: RNA polymerase II transcription factor B subunit 4 [Bogoriella megaspora]
MNAIDGTDRQEASLEGPPPALLVIILDTNPYAWHILRDTISLLNTIANLLVFINAHLAFNNANKVAVIASHTDRAVWLYPTPPHTQRRDATNGASNQNGTANGHSNGRSSRSNNKYKPFAEVEEALMDSARRLASSTDSSTLENSTSTMIAGALSKALAYISKTALSYNANNTSDMHPGYSFENTATSDPTDPNTNPSGLQSRIMLLSVSTSLATQYIPLMNAIFAAQRLRVPIDVLSLNPSTSASSNIPSTTTPSAFLQQAADATTGIFYTPPTPRSRSTPLALLPTLLTLFLPDQTARRALLMPSAASTSTSGTAINFQAACFCHQRTVTVGYVCSICLSIFCEECDVVREGVCWTCGTKLRLGRYGRQPVVVAPERRKKKKGAGTGRDGVGSGAGTPVGTPGQG